jgi:hypothetical protein
MQDVLPPRAGVNTFAFDSADVELNEGRRSRSGVDGELLDNATDKSTGTG